MSFQAGFYRTRGRLSRGALTEPGASPGQGGARPIRRTPLRPALASRPMGVETAAPASRSRPLRPTPTEVASGCHAIRGSKVRERPVAGTASPPDDGAALRPRQRNR